MAACRSRVNRDRAVLHKREEGVCFEIDGDEYGRLARRCWLLEAWRTQRFGADSRRALLVS